MNLASKKYIAQIVACKDLFFTCFYIFLCFLPIVLGYDEHDFQKYLSQDILSESIHSLSYRYALVATICTSAPLLLDLVLDYYSSLSANRRAVLSRCKIISIIMITDIFYFAVVIPENACYIIPSMHHAREIAILYIILTFILENRPNLISVTSFRVITFNYGIGKFFKALLPFLDPDAKSKLIIGAAGVILQAIAAAVGIRVFYISMQNFSKLNKVKELTQQDRCAIVYIVSISLVIVAIWAIYFTMGLAPWQETKANYLIAYSYTILSLSMIVTILNGRINRQEAINTKNMLDKKKRFVRYVSHELRTPLNIVYLGLQLLKKELQENEKHAGSVGNTFSSSVSTVTEISVSCDTAICILNDLLDYDKLDEGTMKLELSEYDVNELIFSAASPFSVQAREAGILLILRKSKNCPKYLRHCKITADKYKINQVVRNLVSNALKFTPQGGSVDLKVNIIRNSTLGSTAADNSNRSNSNRGNRFIESIHNMNTTATAAATNGAKVVNDDNNAWLRIIVSDTGAGISQENQSKLFKEIIQFNPGKLQGGHGSGLGLWISRGIIDLHGGRIRVYSEGEGYGSTFIVDIPIKIDPAIEAVEEEAVANVEDSQYKPLVTDESNGVSNTITGGTTEKQNTSTVRRSVWSQQRLSISLRRSHGGHENEAQRDALEDANNVQYLDVSPVVSDFTSRILPFLSAGTPYSQVQVHPVRSGSTNTNCVVTEIGGCGDHYLDRNSNYNNNCENKSFVSDCDHREQPLLHQHQYQYQQYPSRGTRHYSRHAIIDIEPPIDQEMCTSLPRPDPYLTSSSIHNEYSSLNRNSVTPLRNYLAPSTVTFTGVTTLPISSTISSALSNGLRILVVDDSEMNRKMTCRVMQGSAQYCDQATDGLEAVDIIRKSLEQGPNNGTTGTTTTTTTTSRQYDVILMDYMMPNMDGPTATKAIRGLGFSGQIIGITGNALPCDITTFMNHGANKVLTKPFNINELNAALAMSYDI